jgi:hypothetical protein
LSDDESKLDIAVGRAARAQDLIDNELLKEAFTTLEATYLKAWRETKIEDVMGREKLFLAVDLVGKVRDHFSIVINDGKLAMAEIKIITETAERKKRSGLGYR